LVGYPIFRLATKVGGLRTDVVQYVRDLEEVLIQALHPFGIQGERIASYTGVWVGGAKIAAIGVKVTAKAVTQHGFALNVNTDMDYFKGIIPCGIDDKPVTSMEQLCGTPQEMDRVRQHVIEAFHRVFG
jgi:lipoate-protein ligase B